MDMKNLVYIFLIGVFCFSINTNSNGQDSYEQLKPVFKIFDDINFETGFILNRGFLDPERLENSKIKFPTILPSPNSQGFVITNPIKWQLLYLSLMHSEVNGNKILPSLEELNLVKNDNEISIGIIDINGEYVDPDLIESNFSQSTKRLEKTTPIDQFKIFAISNLKSEVKSGQVNFKLDPYLYFSNSFDKILGLEIDFDDGNGYQFFEITDKVIPINYRIKGEKNLRFKLLTDKRNILSFSKLTVKMLDQPIPSYQNEISTVNHITSSESSIPGGIYEVYNGCDGVFDKPIIIVEGFDPLKDRTPQDLRNKYDDAGFWPLAKSQGYDLVALKFTDNHDYIQNNAQVVKALIHEINQLKEGDFEIIIIGESMGGLATRVAIAELEEDNFDHGVGLYVSFDSPHKGANIPLGLQKVVPDIQGITFIEILDFLVNAINFLSFDTVFDGLVNGVDDIDQLVAANNSPAARQMLVRQLGHLNDINPDFLDFQDFLNSVGFPEESRNISLINGSNIAKIQAAIDENNELDIGEKFMNKQFGCQCCFFKATIDVWVSPINQSNAKVSDVEIKIPFGLFPCILLQTTNKETKGTFYDKAYDRESGGSKDFPGGNNHDQFSFVNSNSGIALDQNLYDSSIGLEYYNESSSNPLRTKSKIVQNGLTLFDDIYSTPNNTGHIKIPAPIQDQFDKIVEREVMGLNLFLQNKEIKDGWNRDFEALNSITTGKNINPSYWADKEVKEGDFIIQVGADVTFRSEENISLKPGTVIKHGSSFTAGVENLDYCSESTLDQLPLPEISIKIFDDENMVSFNVENLADSLKDLKYDWLLIGEDTRIEGNDKRFQVSDLKAGQYSIVSTLNNGVKAYSKTFIITKQISEFKELSFAEDMKFNSLDKGNVIVYPNPFTDNISLEFNKELEENLEVSISNNLGQFVGTISLSKGDKNYALSLLDYPPGIFYLTLINSSGEKRVFKITRIAD